MVSEFWRKLIHPIGFLELKYGMLMIIKSKILMKILLKLYKKLKKFLK